MEREYPWRTLMNKKKLKYIITHPQYVFLMLGHRGFFKWMSDELYLKIGYRIKMGKKLNIQSPVTYNEKIQWLKLNYKNPSLTNLADKYEVRKYVEKKIGDQYLIPLLGVWNDTDSIDYASLPEEFVLKCTHDSGSVIICRDKSKLNYSKTKKKLDRILNQNYYWGQREWVYDNIKPRIIAEKLITSESEKDLKDYKFFVFDGQVRFMFVASDRSTDVRFDFFDREFNPIPVSQKHKKSDKKIVKPENYEEMVRLAEKLAEDFPHARIDFYNVDGEILFGEITFFHFSGWEKFEPEHFDTVFGSWLQLPDTEER